ncbi:MAG: transposase [Fervidobacterium sp.]|uniref:IS110 family transposase n=1 Tax=Fervidobacterium sp. TaxID=1871331 RepID=UPI00309CDA91
MAILAIDVSKNYLSFFSDFIGSGTVENSPQGIVELFNKAFASSSDFSLVLESTGVFSFNVANFFFQNNVPVFWVKTDNIKLYRKILNRPKTDKIDAELIFSIASKFPESLVPFVNNSYIISELRNLTRLV